MTDNPAIFEYRHIVREDEIDELGHVNNLYYLHWTQAAATAHSDSLGWPANRYLALQSGWVVRTHEIEYLLPAIAGEEILVQTWVADMKKVSSLRRFLILRAADQARLAVAATNFAYIDYRTARLSWVPAEVAQAYPIFAGMIFPKKP